jgi:hypothetical protein
MALRPARRLPPEKFDWEEEVKSILKAEIKRRKSSYRDLVDLLKDVGVKITEPALRNKISRGNFNAVFFLQCLTALGATSMHFGGDWEYEPGARGNVLAMVRRKDRDQDEDAD